MTQDTPSFRPMGSPQRRPVYATRPRAIIKEGGTRPEAAPAPRGSVALRTGCATALVLAAMGAAPAALAQSVAFQGTPTVTSGGNGANIMRGPTDVIQLNGPQTVIDWQPFSTTGTGTIDFLPNGSTARFENNTQFGVTDFTVLNRIQPVTATGIPISRVIAFNGLVQSQINGAPGGSVWFYTPGGIVVGATGVFDVGSLVLTSNAIDTTGGLFGSNGAIRFRGTAGSTSSVTLSPGAQINALSAGSYVALVAPRVEQGGTVTVNGSTAYVGAEQADITINGGLFDIAITTGTTDTNGVVHTGTTNGPATAPTSGNPDPQRIYMVALPKNTALTMLLSGSIGYTPASGAVQDNSAVVLGAGYDVTGGDLAEARNATSTAAANLTLNGSNITSALTSNAAGAITIGGGTVQFQKAAAFRSLSSVTMTANVGESITSLDNLSLYAGNDGTGGTISVSANGTGNPSALPGQISVAGQLYLNASATGNTATGIDATGGTVTVQANGGAIDAGVLAADATANGGLGTTRSGNATGGTIGLSVTNGGQMDIANATLLDVSGNSGYLQSGSPNDGGNATGGTINFLGNGGFLDLGQVQATAQATGGTAGNGVAGDATSGNIIVDLRSGSHDWTSFFGDVSTAPGYSDTGAGAFGAGNPGTTGISVDISGTGRLNIAQSVSLYADAHSNGGGTSGGAIRAGQISVRAHDGGGLFITQDLTASAQAVSVSTPYANTPAASADAVGGTIAISGEGGTFSAGGLTASANAQTTIATGTAGIASGGTITLFATQSSGLRGRFALTDCEGYGCIVTANGRGSSGMAGSDGTGGTILLYESDADFSATDTMTLRANGQGGTALNNNGLAGVGGNGLGGTITIETRAGQLNNGVMTFNTVTAGADGLSAPVGEGPGFNIGDGGTGTGGITTLSLLGGTLTASSIDLGASGQGGDASNNCSACAGGTTPFQGGTGFGGSSAIALNGGTATINSLSLTATGRGGDAASSDAAPAAPGEGRGGTVSFDARSGDLTTNSITLAANGSGGSGATQDDANGANGGAAFGGFATFQMDNLSTATITTNTLNISAGATGGAGAGAHNNDTSNSYDAGNGGVATGGIASVILQGFGTLDAGAVTVSAHNVGGNGGTDDTGNDGGNAGAGTGGTALFQFANEDHDIGALTIDASGQGGVAGDARTLTGFDQNNNPIYSFGPGRGGNGAIGQGGDARLALDIDPTLTNLTIDARGIGSAGGNGAIGGDGGAGLGSGGPSGNGTGALLAVNFEALTVTNQLTITAEGIGGNGGDGYRGPGGRGGDAIGGSARATVASTDAMLTVGNGMDILASASAGNGGTSGGAANGIGATGADGGTAAGGIALLSATDTAHILMPAAATIAADATGGNGSTGVTAAFGGDGGDGGSATGGTATVQIANAQIYAANGGSGYAISTLATGGQGGGGGDGTGSGATGGYGGDGGNGTGGLSMLDASNGDYALGTLTIDASGTAGSGGAGGIGPGTPGNPSAIPPVLPSGPIQSGYGNGGSATGGIARALNSDDGTIAAGAVRGADSLTMRADGNYQTETGFASLSAGGRVEIADTSTAPDGGLNIFNTIEASARGYDYCSCAGIFVSSAANPIHSFNTILSADSHLSFDFTGGGSVRADGQIYGYGSDGITITHTAQPATPVNSLSGGSIALQSYGDITAAPGSILRASDSVAIDSYGGAIAIDAAYAGGTMALNGQQGVTAHLVSAGGTTNLTATNGAIAVSGLTSTGALTATGQSIDLTTSGPLIITSATATAGDLRLTGDALTITQAQASGNIAINAASLTANTLTAGGTIDGTTRTGFLGVGTTMAGDTVSYASATSMIVNYTTTTTGDIILTTQAGQAQVGDSSAARDFRITANGDGLIESGTIRAGRSLDFTADAYVFVGTAIAGDDITLTARTGQVSLQNGRTTGIGAVGGSNITLNGGTDAVVYNANAVDDIIINGNGGAAYVSTSATAGRDILMRASTTNVFANTLTAGRDVHIVGHDDVNAYNVNAGGNITLTSTNNGVNTTTLSGQAITIDAEGGDASLGSPVTASGALRITATGTASFSGLTVGQTIDVASGDIALASGAQLGTQGTTSALTLTANNSQQPTFIGGADQTGGYSLSADEISRIAATNVTVSASRVSTVGQQSLGSSRAPDVIVRGFTLTAGQNGNLGSGGTFAINTPGKLRVEGAVRLTGLNAQGGLSINATDAIEVIAGSGSIDLRQDDKGTLGGVLTLSTNDFIGATLSAISDVAAATTLDARDQRLAQNDGVLSEDGLLRAGTIRLSVINGAYIQNTGASTALPDRRGFTANRLDISTEDSTTQLVLNGRIADGQGGFVTGVQATSLIGINGVLGGKVGDYADRSTINGCLISSPGSCTFGGGLDSHDVIERVLDPTVSIGQLFPVAIVELRDFVAQGYPPLIDEPVTGAGNEDLWDRDCTVSGTNGCDTPTAP